MPPPSVSTEEHVQDAEDRPSEMQIASREAFTEAFQRFYVPLVRYAHRITGDAAGARDVLQDVFAKLWEDRERITVEVSLKALLYTMVRNRALNANRRAKRAASDVDVEAVRGRHEVEPEPDAALDSRDLQRLLYRWIDDLPPRRAEAFTLSRYQGLTHSEIAAIMGVSVRTVDTHILLALRELRRRLDELQDED